jgi:mRNA-degrading endonuclease RelE of RelBE toxin-antitoxin system
MWMRFVLTFTESALDDLRFFRKYEQTLVLDQTYLLLQEQPATETRNRKPLEPNELADWELRIGRYRVFYDVDSAEGTVIIKAIGHKEHNRLFVRGKEFKL